MDQKTDVPGFVTALAFAVFEPIRSAERRFKDHCVPSARIRELVAEHVSVPSSNRSQWRERGWSFASLARSLENRHAIEHRKNGNRTFGVGRL